MKESFCESCYTCKVTKEDPNSGKFFLVRGQTQNEMLEEVQFAVCSDCLSDEDWPSIFEVVE